MIIHFILDDNSVQEMYQLYNKQIRDNQIINTSKICTISEYRKVTPISTYLQQNLIEVGLEINGAEIPMGAYREDDSEIEQYDYTDIEVYARVVDYIYDILLRTLKGELNTPYLEIDGNELVRKELERLGKHED